MNAAKFTGTKVRLAALDIDKDPDLWSQWGRNSEYQQLLDWGPCNLFTGKQVREWIEKNADNSYTFSIHSLDDDKTIGFLELDSINWTSRDAWLGVGIGEQEYWGKGYGTDAINILLRFAFEELNLNRVTLNVFEYNERAIKSYQKLGFQVEGKQRQIMSRWDQRWDIIFMGVLRSEWEALNPVRAVP